MKLSTQDITPWRNTAKDLNNGRKILTVNNKKPPAFGESLCFLLAMLKENDHVSYTCNY